MTKYVVTLTEWRLLIDANSEEEARQQAAAELREKIKPECLIAREDATAFYVEPSAEYPAYEPCECGCHKTGLLCHECCGGPPVNRS